MSHGLAVMSEMVNAWHAKGVSTATFTVTGDLTSGDDLVRNVSDMSDILIGLNLSGTGVAGGATVKEVVTDDVLRMSQVASSGAAGSTITVEFLPMPVKYEGA